MKTPNYRLNIPVRIETEDSTLIVADHRSLSYEQLQQAEDIFECPLCADGDALRSGEACAYCGFDKDKDSR